MVEPPQQSIRRQRQVESESEGARESVLTRGRRRQVESESVGTIQSVLLSAKKEELAAKDMELAAVKEEMAAKNLELGSMDRELLTKEASIQAKEEIIQYLAAQRDQAMEQLSSKGQVGELYYVVDRSV